MNKTSEKSTKESCQLGWEKRETTLLVNWAEICSSYRWLHYQTHRLYKKRNIGFMIPLIIMSTLTGTANFAQSSIPLGMRNSTSQVIGGVNLVAAILTTIYQFLKVAELMEKHKISSLSYGQLSRNIVTELNIPVKDRTYSSSEFIKICRSELDKLLEQSPTIPGTILREYEEYFGKSGICKPEIISVNKITICDNKEARLGNIVANAAIKYKNNKEDEELSLMTNAIKSITGTSKYFYDTLTGKKKKKMLKNARTNVTSISSYEEENDYKNQSDINIELDTISKKYVTTTENNWNTTIDMLKKPNNESIESTYSESNESVEYNDSNQSNESNEYNDKLVMNL